MINLFKKVNKKLTEITGSVWGNVIYQNDNLKIVSDSCSICYDKPIKANNAERAKYIADKVRMGHESILEHSNVITKYIFNKSEELLEDLSRTLELCRYLNTHVVFSKSEVTLFIGGSIRGYKYIFRENYDADNKIINAIKQNMYQLHSCYFVDMIEDQLFDQNYFSDEIIEIDNNDNNIIYNDRVNIIMHDDLNKIKNEVGNIRIAMKFASVSILFRGVSRSIANQLTRHRAAITQLSQRYTDSSNCKFIDPTQFKPDIYSKGKTYLINGAEFTPQQLGESIIDIYTSLREQEMLKEDARSFLPMNVETSLYMTFTYFNLLHFLQLRTSKKAQAEIRSIALELEEKVKSYYKDYVNYDYLMPVYQFIETDLNEKIENVDKVLKVNEEELNIAYNKLLDAEDSSEEGVMQEFNEDKPININDEDEN